MPTSVEKMTCINGIAVRIELTERTHSSTVQALASSMLFNQEPYISYQFGHWNGAWSMEAKSLLGKYPKFIMFLMTAASPPAP